MNLINEHDEDISVLDYIVEYCNVYSSEEDFILNINKLRDDALILIDKYRKDDLVNKIKTKFMYIFLCNEHLDSSHLTKYKNVILYSHNPLILNNYGFWIKTKNYPSFMYIMFLNINMKLSNNDNDKIKFNYIMRNITNIDKRINYRILEDNELKLKIRLDIDIKYRYRFVEDLYDSYLLDELNKYIIELNIYIKDKVIERGISGFIRKNIFPRRSNFKRKLYKKQKRYNELIEVFNKFKESTSSSKSSTKESTSSSKSSTKEYNNITCLKIYMHQYILYTINFSDDIYNEFNLAIPLISSVTNLETFGQVYISCDELIKLPNLKSYRINKYNNKYMRYESRIIKQEIDNIIHYNHIIELYKRKELEILKILNINKIKLYPALYYKDTTLDISIIKKNILDNIDWYFKIYYLWCNIYDN